MVLRGILLFLQLFYLLYLYCIYIVFNNVFREVSSSAPSMGEAGSSVVLENNTGVVVEDNRLTGDGLVCCPKRSPPFCQRACVKAWRFYFILVILILRLPSHRKASGFMRLDYEFGWISPGPGTGRQRGCIASARSSASRRPGAEQTKAEFLN